MALKEGVKTKYWRISSLLSRQTLLFARARTIDTYINGIEGRETYLVKSQENHCFYFASFCRFPGGQGPMMTRSLW